MKVIPNRNLFQILITDGGVEPQLPATISENIRSLREHHPEHAYNRLNGADIDAFIGAHFDADTLAAFRGFRPYAYKADLGRLCLLLVHGGIYADLVMRIVRPLVLPSGKQMMCFRDSPGTGLWTVSTSLIVSVAGRRELKLAIEMVVANYEARFYGASPLETAGPGVFGRALAIVNHLEDIDVGAFDYLSNDRNGHNLGHTDGAGCIVSMRMKSGRFDQVGVRGTNHYPDMWTARTVYGEKMHFDHAHPALHLLPSMCRDVGGVRRSSVGILYDVEAQGWLVYGPYIGFRSGEYVATYAFDQGSAMVGLHMDVCVMVDGEQRSMAERIADRSDGLRLSIAFALDRDVVSLQVRLRSPGGLAGVILALEIEPR